MIDKTLRKSTLRMNKFYSMMIEVCCTCALAGFDSVIGNGQLNIIYQSIYFTAKLQKQVGIITTDNFIPPLKIVLWVIIFALPVKSGNRIIVNMITQRHTLLAGFVRAARSQRQSI